MPIDYKYRTENRSAHRRKRKSGRNESFAMWKWMLITSLIICFVVFLFYLRTEGNKQSIVVLPIPQFTEQKNPPAQKKLPDIKDKAVKDKNVKDKIDKVKSEPEVPHFDFYTILPEKETVIPDHEIDTRTREEQVGMAKETKYILQAGSFRSFKEADRMRAKLALMGIESRIEKAKVGSVNWYRIKLGPFTRMSSVSIIRSRLRKNGIDAVVTEVGR